MIKKAIIFSGESRFIIQGYNSLNKNLKNFKEYDIFIHTWKNELSDQYQIYNPKKIIIEPQKNIIPTYVSNYSQSDFIHYSMFYSMRESINLKINYEKENNMIYDLVIRTRSDISLEDELNPEQFNLNDTIYSPNVCSNSNVISDWLNFSSSEMINRYCEIYNNIESYRKNGVFINSGEEIITYMLKTNSIKYQKIPCKLFLLRNPKKHPQLSHFWKYA